VSDLSLELLSHLSGAANAKDAYVRLLDRARGFAHADAAVVLRPHGSREGHEVLVPLGLMLRREFAFASSVQRPELTEGEIVRDADRLLFQGTSVGANLLLRTPGSECHGAVVRLEWSDAEAMALDPLRRLREALPFVAPLIHSLRKYDSKISIHPTTVDPRAEAFDSELDTPDPTRLCRRAYGLIDERVKLEGAAIFVLVSGAFVPAPGGLFGKADGSALPDFARLAAEERRIVASGRTLAVPCLFKGAAIAVVVMTPKSKPDSSALAYISDGIARAALHVQKARMLAASRAANPANPLLLVGVPRDVLEQAESYADADAPVLIKGETGTGKESIARFIHHAGSRRAKPFLPFNCAELAEHLAESQLFGHVKGAFTGAHADAPGLFEQAHLGTLFLDEIHVLAPALQAKFLRAVETGEIRPVGGAPRRVDVRIVVATNQDLPALAAQGRFLPDLFMRLDVLELALPPLRANRQALGRIADVLLVESARRNRKEIHALTPRARHALFAYDYPGNVRELKNIIEKAVVTTKQPYVDVDVLPKKLTGARPDAAHANGDLFEPDYESFKNSAERSYLMRLLERSGGSVSEAARMSGLHRTHIYNLIKKHALNAERFRA
jgi:DNA-binding NtrC family response regulator